MPITRNGVDLTNIIQTGTTTLTGFTGITGLSRSLAWEGCSDLGITKSGIDIANSFTAKYVDYTSSANGVTIPTGVNQIKVICIGGGGGGGGGSGLSGTYRSGGGGGGGAIVIADITKGNQNTYDVIVGTGGHGSAQYVALYYNDSTIRGYRHFDSVGGNETKFTYQTTLSAMGGKVGGDSLQTSTYVTTDGAGGEGGTGSITGNYNNFYYSKGKDGLSASGSTPGEPGYLIQDKTKYPDLGNYGSGYNYGYGGWGGSFASNNRGGGDGQQGFCRVYYLY